MKKLLRLFVFLLAIIPLAGKAQTQEGTVKVGKDAKSGFITTSNYDKEQVETALAGKLAEAGLRKPGKTKKFYTYKGVLWPEVSSNKVDVFYKVVSKKRKTLIQMVVSKGYDNYITTTSDGAAAANIITFLARVDAAVARNLEIQKKEQELRAMDQSIQQTKDAMQQSEEAKQQKAKELEALKNKKD